MSDELSSNDSLQPVVQLLRTPVPPAPGLGMRAHARAARRQRRNRQIARVSALALLVVAVGLTVHHPASGTEVTFSIDAPAGRSVSVVGDFTDWRSDRVRLTPAGSGVWRATVRLPPGRYRFAYLVDHAQWRADTVSPSAPDDFGRPTSILTVAGQ